MSRFDSIVSNRQGQVRANLAALPTTPGDRVFARFYPLTDPHIMSGISVLVNCILDNEERDEPKMPNAEPPLILDVATASAFGSILDKCDVGALDKPATATVNSVCAASTGKWLKGIWF